MKHLALLTILAATCILVHAREVSFQMTYPFGAFKLESSRDLTNWVYSVTATNIVVVYDCDPSGMRFWRITPLP